jgi:phage shock protein PspC (stress-responsive transcriptional regulator)
MAVRTCGVDGILQEVYPFESDDRCNVRPESCVSGLFQGLGNTHKLPSVIRAIFWIIFLVDTRSSGCVSRYFIGALAAPQYLSRKLMLKWHIC